MEEYVKLENLAQGAVSERFGIELQSVLENIFDRNTDAKTAREITIKVKIKPTESRESASVDVTAVSKLAPYKPLQTTLYIGTVGGEVQAQEHNPKQMRFDDVARSAASDSKGVS